MARKGPHYGDTVQIGSYRIEATYLAFVADLLRKHNARKRMLHDLEEGVIRSTPSEDLTGMPRGSGPSDQTHAAAVRLQDISEPTFKARAHLRASIALIDDVYNHLPVDQKDIIRELYFRRQRTLLGVAEKMSMTKATVCRQRNYALLSFAIRLVGDHILLPGDES